MVKILRDCINGSFRKHSTQINMNPGRLLVYLKIFPLSVDATCVAGRHGHKETFLILSPDI